mgnify:CR=1 FL=1
MQTKENRQKTNQKYYAQNREKVQAVNQEARRRIREYVWGLKEQGSCVDCGVSNPIVLEFDHLPGHEKKGHIASLVSSGYGKATIDAEIAKCELVCANCHKVRTHERKL